MINKQLKSKGFDFFFRFNVVNYVISVECFSMCARVCVALYFWDGLVDFCCFVCFVISDSCLK